MAIQIETGPRRGLMVSAPMRVEDAWIDYNGHLNMAYYNVLFDRAVDDVFAQFDLGPDYLKAHDASFFTLEAHLTYLREIHAGDAVEATFRIVALDDKRVHTFQQLYHIAGGFLSATSEAMHMHVDMGQKKSAPFPATVKAKLQTLHDSQAHLPRPEQLGHVIALPARPR